MNGKIIGIDGGGTLYRIWVKKEDNSIFSIPVEHRYFSRIIEDKGNIMGKEIEYKGEIICFIEDLKT
jgi:hypothetical protein